MSNQLATMPISDMASSIANSGMLGFRSGDYHKVLTLLLLAESEGIHPMHAIRDYHVISGRPTMKAEAILSRFQKAGGSVLWKIYHETEVQGVFSHPQGGEVSITWNIDMAKKANLLSNEVWKKYPTAMLRSRCISEGVRTVYPAVLSGFYTPEEIADLPKNKKIIIGETIEETPIISQDVVSSIYGLIAFECEKNGLDFNSVKEVLISQWIAPSYKDRVVKSFSDIPSNHFNALIKKIPEKIKELLIVEESLISVEQINALENIFADYCSAKELDFTATKNRFLESQKINSFADIKESEFARINQAIDVYFSSKEGGE